MFPHQEFAPRYNTLWTWSVVCAEIDGCDPPTKRFPLGRTNTKGYKLFGSVRFNQSKNTVVSPPSGVGRISALGSGGPLLPVSPPMTITVPFGSTAAANYPCMNSNCSKRISAFRGLVGADGPTKSDHGLTLAEPRKLCRWQPVGTRLTSTCDRTSRVHMPTMHRRGLSTQ